MLHEAARNDPPPLLADSANAVDIDDLARYARFALASYGFVFAAGASPLASLPDVVCRLTGVARDDVIYFNHQYVGDIAKEPPRRRSSTGKIAITMCVVYVYVECIGL
jgi:hypothetical protein